MNWVLGEPAEIGAHFVYWPQLVEEGQRELSHLIGVVRAVIETTGKPSGAGKKLVGAAALFFIGDADGILFGNEIEQDAFARMHRVLAPDGFLALGAAETVVGLTTRFVPCTDRRGLYRPVGAVSTTAPSLLQKAAQSA